MHCSWECFGFVSQRAVMTSPRFFFADLSQQKNDQLSPAITVERDSGRKWIILSLYFIFFLPSAESFSVSLLLFIFLSSTFTRPFLFFNCSILNWPGELCALQLIKCTRTSPTAAKRAPAYKWLNIKDILHFSPLTFLSALTMKWKENYMMGGGVDWIRGVRRIGEAWWRLFFFVFVFLQEKQHKTRE